MRSNYNNMHFQIKHVPIQLSNGPSLYISTHLYIISASIWDFGAYSNDEQLAGSPEPLYIKFNMDRHMKFGVAYAQKPLIKSHSDVSNGARCPDFGICRPPHPYFVCVCKLWWAFQTSESYAHKYGIFFGCIQWIRIKQQRDFRQQQKIPIT